MRMRVWVLALLLALVAAAPAGATSWAKLTPQQVLKEAHVVLVGRVSGALAAWEEGENGVYNGMVLDVEAYLENSSGPARVTVRLFGGTVCNWLGRCKSIAGGMEGKEMVGQHLLLFLKRSPDGKHLDLVGGPNGLVRLAENRLGVMDQRLSAEEAKTWEQFLKVAEPRQPAPGQPEDKLEAPRSAEAAPKDTGAPLRSLTFVFIGGAALLALGVSVGALWWRQRVK